MADDARLELLEIITNKSRRKKEDISNPASPTSISECPVEFIESTAYVEEEGLGVGENIEEERRSNFETNSKTFSKLKEKNLAADTQFKFDITKNYPTDLGHYPSTIQDAALKREILMYGSCRPMGHYQYKDEYGKMITNFKSSYYHQFVNNIQEPRSWLCYSMEWMKPFCEVYWIFADRSKQIFDDMAWVNGVSGSTHSMLEKIKSMRELQIILSRRQFILNGSAVKL
eukprot:gene16197-7568_t